MSEISFLPDTMNKAVFEALGEFADKLARLEVPAKSEPEVPEEPKSYFIDPDMLADDYGMGYRNIPSRLSDDVLRQAVDRVDIIGSIVQLRKNQIAAFCRPQPNKYSVGFKLVPVWGEELRQLDTSEKERVAQLTRFILNTGIDRNLKRGSLDTFIRKTVPDTLSLDRVTFEKVRTRGGDMHSFHAVDAATIRIATPKNRRGTPTAVAEQRKRIEYAQVINSQKRKEYTADEMAFLVRNPRTDINAFGYGFSEVEMLINTITWLLWALTYNAKGFSQGTTAKGLLNIKGRLNEQKLQELRKSWYQQLVGVGQAWKTPIVNSDEVQWIPFTATNKEMEYQLWLEFLVKCACAVFLVDPAEINHDLRGSVAQQPIFMSTNEAQQKASKDRGLQPLLRFYADGINNHVILPMDDRFQFEFAGLDAKTEEQAVELRTKQVSSYLTVNETRALEDRPPMKEGGDLILNPVFIAGLQMKQQAAMQQAQAGGAPQQMAPDGNAIPEHEEDRMFADEEHGPEEHQGAQRLLEYANQKPSKIEPVPVDDPMVFRNDWVSSVHASLPQRGQNLRKSQHSKRRSRRLILVDLD